MARRFANLVDRLQIANHLTTGWMALYSLTLQSAISIHQGFERRERPINFVTPVASVNRQVADVLYA
ncbi:MAG: hypothetical protein KDB01_16045, partial [Planctomycetaceae bacterium]|nr:hypothetical protein [Planctomycetaceae bacterium]